LDKLVEGCILGNTAALVKKGDGKTYEVVGDRTDGALLLWAKEFPNISIADDERVIDEYVFDSKTKTIITVCKRLNKTYVFVRGAPEAVLQKSTLTRAEEQEATKHFEELAKEGLRVIGFGVKIDGHSEHLSRSRLERDLTFLGFLGLYDPPRKEVADAVQKAHRAGIHVAMVTGDNELTAVSLAHEIGLVDKNDDVVTGEQLRSLTDDELSEILTKIRVFARTRPEEKLRLVTLLQKMGFVVGVTGDGVNDALALEQANVGIAMGEGGTDVAKEASDIVLTDDNFATLIKAVEEGRIIYKNILNAIIYLLSGNLAELSLVFMAVLFQLPFPFVPTQILWINLVTDSLPALALAIGSKDASVLRKKPRDPNERILAPRRILLICIIGFSLSFFLLFLFSYLLKVNTEAQARSAIFNLLIYFHLLIVMAIGRHSLAKGNIALILTVIFIFLLQLFVDSSPFFRGLFLLN
ncbi:HAD-IC family P-type ATPase, partial [Patescibacteria group bacterium]|nr:HAD-IC family P-type ATPase [Patescibacteria group bacterium]